MTLGCSVLLRSPNFCRFRVWGLGLTFWALKEEGVSVDGYYGRGRCGDFIRRTIIGIHFVIPA